MLALLVIALGLGSWQTVEAVKVASATRGAARAVALTAATWADKSGNGIYPSNKTLRAAANASRNTVRDTLDWMCRTGEAEFVRRRRQGNAEYTFRPLHLRQAQIEYWLERGGQPLTPGQPLTEGGESRGEGGQSQGTPGSTTDPEPSVKPLEKHQEKAVSPHFERGSELLATIESWKTELPGILGSRHEEKARAALVELEAQLDKHLVNTLAVAA